MGRSKILPALPSTGSEGNSYVMWAAAGTEDLLDTTFQSYSPGQDRGLTSHHTELSVIEGQNEPVAPLPSKDEDDRGLHRFRYDS
jgi:hypothetical protein